MFSVLCTTEDTYMYQPHKRCKVSLCLCEDKVCIQQLEIPHVIPVVTNIAKYAFMIYHQVTLLNTTRTSCSTIYMPNDTLYYLASTYCLLQYKEIEIHLETNLQCLTILQVH